MAVKIFVKVKASSKKPYLEKLDDNHFMIAVKEPAKEGKANQAIARALAKHLGVARSQIELISGAKAKHKVFKII